MVAFFHEMAICIRYPLRRHVLAAPLHVHTSNHRSTRAYPAQGGHLGMSTYELGGQYGVRLEVMGVVDSKTQGEGEGEGEGEGLTF